MNSGHGMEMKKDQAFSLVPEKHLLFEVEVTYVSIYVSKRSFSPAWIFDGAANAISIIRVLVNLSFRMTAKTVSTMESLPTEERLLMEGYSSEWLALVLVHFM